MGEEELASIELPQAALDYLAEHEPMEATGGYIECSCSWPSREQWESGEHYVVHLLPKLMQFMVVGDSDGG